eukprot:gene24907-biopygen10290
MLYDRRQRHPERHKRLPLVTLIITGFIVIINPHTQDPCLFYKRDLMDLMDTKSMRMLFIGTVDTPGQHRVWPPKWPHVGGLPESTK